MAADSPVPDSTEAEPGKVILVPVRRYSVGSCEDSVTLKPVTGPSRWLRTAKMMFGRWLANYALEWRLTDARQAARVEQVSGELAKVVNESDVACFAKPGGLCPFCTKATKLLEEFQTECRFTLHVADLLGDERDALGFMLNDIQGSTVKLLFPVIFVCGEWLPGGFEELQQRRDDGRLRASLENVAADRAVVASLGRDKVPVLPAKPQLFHQAGGGPWLTIHSSMYGNVLRGIAFLQICLLVPAHLMDTDEMRDYSIPLLILVGVDALIFSLVGPAPFTPLGVLSTLLVWNRRGSIVPTWPYKLTFLYYAVGAVGAIACEKGSEQSMCKILGSDALVYSMMINSVYLCIFRF